MRYATKPRHDAQMERMPLAVRVNPDGFHISHVGAETGMIVSDQADWSGDCIRFTDPNQAYRIMREAEGAAAAMLAKVFGR
jgi:hypothetical protein